MSGDVSGDISPAQSSGRPPSARAAALARAVAFAALWIVLMPSTKTGDLAMGVFATAAATALSLRLLPPAMGQVRVLALLLQVPRLLLQSVLAGVDVARRALAPTIDLHPGMVDYPVSLPPGVARTSFATITSLLPGTVPAGESATHITYHALDTTQPVVAELQAEEQRLGALLGGRSAP